MVILGWSFFLFLVYKTAGAKIENKVYDPFEILGLSAVSVIFTVISGWGSNWDSLFWGFMCGCDWRESSELGEARLGDGLLQKGMEVDVDDTAGRLPSPPSFDIGTKR